MRTGSNSMGSRKRPVRELSNIPEVILDYEIPDASKSDFCVLVNSKYKAKSHFDVNIEKSTFCKQYFKLYP